VLERPLIGVEVSLFSPCFRRRRYLPFGARYFPGFFFFTEYIPPIAPSPKRFFSFVDDFQQLSSGASPDGEGLTFPRSPIPRVGRGATHSRARSLDLCEPISSPPAVPCLSKRTASSSPPGRRKGPYFSGATRTSMQAFSCPPLGSFFRPWMQSLPSLSWLLRGRSTDLDPLFRVTLDF